MNQLQHIIKAQYLNITVLVAIKILLIIQILKSVQYNIFYSIICCVLIFFIGVLIFSILKVQKQIWLLYSFFFILIVSLSFVNMNYYINLQKIKNPYTTTKKIDWQAKSKQDKAIKNLENEIRLLQSQKRIKTVQKNNLNDYNKRLIALKQQKTPWIKVIKFSDNVDNITFFMSLDRYTQCEILVSSTLLYFLLLITIKLLEVWNYLIRKLKRAEVIQTIKLKEEEQRLKEEEARRQEASDPSIRVLTAPTPIKKYNANLPKQI